MNKLILSGRLPKDGVTRYTQNGNPILEFALAAESGRGDYKQVSWVKCKLLGKRAENLQPYLKKGLYVLVSGEVHLAKWEYQGKQVSGMEMVVDDFDFGGNSRSYQESQYSNNTTTTHATSAQGGQYDHGYGAQGGDLNAKNSDHDDYRDDIPF